MEDDDEIQSHPSPAPNGRIAVTVAAAPPSSNSLTLALPIQNQKTPGSGGGREDCWSEGATAVLIDAWGERYLELSRGNLKQKHWKDVADIVSSREDYAKPPKTDIQCKNRIDTVKKKYKVEKAKIASGAGPSKWRFFDKLDELIGPTAKMSSATPPADASNNNSIYERVPMGIPVGVRSLQKPNRKRAAVEVEMESDDESEPENSVDSSDGLPPESYKRAMMMQNVGAARRGGGAGLMNKKSDGIGVGNKESSSSSSSSMRELTRAILKFGEAYEQAETAKLQQLVEMEKQRMKFAKELELQRIQHFMKTQMELSQLKNSNGGNRRRQGNNNISITSNHHGHGIVGNNNNDGNNNDHNSDSSN